MRKIGVGMAAATLSLALGLTILIGAKTLTLPPLSFEMANDTSVVVTDRNGRLLRPYATKEGRWRLPVDLDQVDEDYLRMLLTYEDKNFYNHQGIDFQALGRAALQLVSSGQIVSGGSTITMQLARLMDGLKARSFHAKLTQLIRAHQLEQRLTKRQILTLYLSLAPFGGNLEGLRSASLAYFGKEPKRLSWSERALLVALPQSPEVRRPDKNPKRARASRDRVLDRMIAAKIISQSEADYAKRAPIPNVRKRFPMYAAHLADQEIQNAPNASSHRLTIDRSLQSKLEQLAKNHVRRIGPKLSAAILVANHQTGEILAHVGSPGYLDANRFGAINMVDAVRSPGSALKPFIYGLAFDQGLAHPETLIEDVPTRFKQYAPQNFDKEFRGTVTIRKALQKSLNIPAVKLLDAVGPARLAHRFEQIDTKLDIPRNLAIALGGVGMPLKSLTTLYAALARGGEPIKLTTKLNEDSRNTEGPRNKPVLSPLAAWYVSNILAGAPPPDNASKGRIAFKTGTSYGHRDAWAVGFDGRHVIAAWVGRPDATPTPGLMGIKAAAPLLFDAFAQLGTKLTPLKDAPEDAILASTANLPPRLIHFADSVKAESVSSSTNVSPVKITFPPNESELQHVSNDSETSKPIMLKAQGGKLPLTWLEDGAPITPSKGRRHILWQPEGTGFHQLTVIDANGDVDRITVRLR